MATSGKTATSSTSLASAIPLSIGWPRSAVWRCGTSSTRKSRCSARTDSRQRRPAGQRGVYDRREDRPRSLPERVRRPCRGDRGPLRPLDRDDDTYGDLCGMLDEVPDEVWRAADVLGGLRILQHQAPRRPPAQGQSRGTGARGRVGSEPVLHAPLGRPNAH